jgi:hypothetical protein
MGHPYSPLINISVQDDYKIACTSHSNNGWTAYWINKTARIGEKSIPPAAGSNLRKGAITGSVVS